MREFIANFSSRVAWFILALICLTSLLLMLGESRNESAIMDELAHIPAGYGYVHNLDYRLNPEHPPLIKALSAIPLALMDLNFPTNDHAWTTDINGQWDMGRKFLYESGNNADSIIQWSRVGPILVTIGLIILIYIWSIALLGKFWALIPSFIFGLSPTVIAHGHYVTTDVGATFGIVIATYFFVKFLMTPSKGNLFWAGFAFGIAQLMKFSAFLLIPFFAFILLVFYINSVIRNLNETDRNQRFKRFTLRAERYLRSFILIMAIGYIVVVYPVYYIFTANYPIQKQASDTEFILTSTGGGPTPDGQICKIGRCASDLTVWMSKNNLTRPIAQYSLGLLMVLQRAAGGNTGYFLGEVSATGSHAYFPIVYALKEPLPILLLVLIALLIGLAKISKNITYELKSIGRKLSDYLTLRFAEFSMLVFVAFYWIYSVASPLNIGVRHIIPTLPFIYILTANSWKSWITKIGESELRFSLKEIARRMKMFFLASLKYVFLIILLTWFTLEVILSHPYHLSYFNEFGGGINNGYRYVTDSNYDWGQDLLRLKYFVASHPEIDKIAVDYFGGGNPKYYLKDKGENWWSDRGDPTQENIHWLAISINTIESATQKLAPGQQRNPTDEYRWLSDIRPIQPGIGKVPEPDFRAGTSIFIYKL
jgi:hypothetical protein